MREVALTPTQTIHGETPNEPIQLYDTSGPYTDPEADINIRKGLNPLRSAWIAERGDTEAYEGRAEKPEDNGWRTPEQAERAGIERFPGALRRPLRAKAGRAVTQMYYAK